MRNFLLVIVCVAFLCSGTSSLAQGTHDQIWLSAGGGLAIRELFLGSSQGLTVAYNSTNLFVSARFVNADRLGSFLPLGAGGGRAYLDYFQEYSLNCGYAKETEGAIYLASIGVGQLQGKYNEERQNSSFKTLCIPLTGQVLWKLAPSIGIGPVLSFNLNGKETFVGIGLNLQVAVLM